MADMGYTIGLEDLAGNAFIALLKEDNTHRVISFKSFELYGEIVVNVLNQQGYEARLKLSRSDTRWVLDNYSDVFEEVVGETPGLRLKENVDIIDLIERFSGCLPLSVLLAFKTAGEQLELC